MANVCIFGVGAIGGFLAARLALTGQHVTGIARGRQLIAIREKGLSLVSGQSVAWFIRRRGSVNPA
jgi:2-dehydropantoate 2-reductase